MSKDMARGMFELTAHIGKCEICQKFWDDANVLINKIQNHMSGDFPK